MPQIWQLRAVFGESSDGQWPCNKSVGLPSIYRQPLIWGRVAEATVLAGGSRLPFPWPHQPALIGGSKAFPGQCKHIISPPRPGSAPWPPPRWTCQELLHWEVTRRLLTTCPNHLNWLLSMQRSSGSTPRPSRMTKLLTLSLKETPATLLGKLISAACIRDLILSVMTHPWPQVRAGTKTEQ